MVSRAEGAFLLLSIKLLLRSLECYNEKLSTHCWFVAVRALTCKLALRTMLLCFSERVMYTQPSSR